MGFYKAQSCIANLVSTSESYYIYHGKQTNQWMCVQFEDQESNKDCPNP